MQDTLNTRVSQNSNIVFGDYATGFRTLCRLPARATTAVDMNRPREPVAFQQRLAGKVILADGVLGH